MELFNITTDVGLGFVIVCDSDAGGPGEVKVLMFLSSDWTLVPILIFCGRK